MTEKRAKEIREGLNVCCTWVEFILGDMRKGYETDRRKECDKCPYRDPEDPAGLNCGERLMHDACELIGDLQREIRKLRTEADFLRGQLTLMESEAKRIP